MCAACAARSLVIRTRFLKSSGRTSLAIAAKSSGFLMSCFGKGIPPFGHSVIAFWTASSSVRAQDTWIWSSFGVPSGLAGLGAPSSHFSQSIRDLLVGGADRDHPVGELARPSSR